MNVSPVGSFHHTLQRAPQGEAADPSLTSHNTELDQSQAAALVSSMVPDAEPPVEPDDTSDAGRARGVIRNLEAGHFRGVADVRLRINFFDLLSAGAAQAAAAVAQEQAPALGDTVSTQIDDLLATRTIDDQAEASLGELRDAFDAAVGTAVVDFAAHGDQDILEQQLRSAFDDLLAELGDVFGPLIEEQEPPPLTLDPTAEGLADVANPPDARNALGVLADLGPSPISADSDPSIAPPAQPDPLPAPAPDDPFAPLLAAFADALDQFLAAVSTAAQLPDPSAPNGKGGAYEKFLAIYNDLRGTQLNELG
jgi:hypothetical protein